MYRKGNKTLLLHRAESGRMRPVVWCDYHIQIDTLIAQAQPQIDDTREIDRNKKNGGECI